MSAPVILRGNYGQLYGSSMLPALEELFDYELARHPSVRDQIFKLESADRDIWQSTSMHDLPLFQSVEEGQDYSFHRQKQGASKTFTMEKFGLGFSISEEAVDDGKFNLIADGVKKLAKSAKETQEVAAMNILNNGFTSETSADGVYVLSASHTLPSGRTFRNKLSTASDLSVSSLETALSDFETQFIGDSGIIYNIKPRVLLVHPSNKRYAMELIGSDLKADTADNNMNSIKQDGLRVISSPHLTDSDAWFLLAAPEDTGLKVITRRPISTKAAGADAGFVNDSILYKASYREDIGVDQAIGIFGSEGA